MSVNLLSDNQVQQFIVEGYLILDTGLSAQFHKDMHESFLKEEKLVAGRSTFVKRALGVEYGNNILPKFPRLQELLDAPCVKGALTSVLGDGFIVHPHRHCHLSKLDQTCHKDSYWGTEKVRYHTPTWAMIFYYPQETTEEMGPTEIFPRSQYKTQHIKYDQTRGNEEYFQRDVLEAMHLRPTLVTVPAGSFVLLHYDLVHRGTAPTSPESARYMVKFQFRRMTVPTRPTWDHRSTRWTDRIIDSGEDDLNAVWSAVWSNMCSCSPDPREEVVSSEELWSSDSTRRLTASYILGSQADVQPLVAAAMCKIEKWNPTAVHGLQLCPDGLATLIRTLVKEEEADALLTAMIVMCGVQSLTLLEDHLNIVLRAATNACVQVRRQSAEALGFLCCASSNTLEHTAALGELFVLLLEDDDAIVRGNAALSVAMAAEVDFGGAVECSLRVVSAEDPDRYARLYALRALSRTAAPADSKQAAADMLRSRLQTPADEVDAWCDPPNFERLFAFYSCPLTTPGHGCY